VQFEFNVTGLAFSHAQVTKFVLNLDRSSHFRRVRLENAQEVVRSNEKLVDFVVSSIVVDEEQN
jgi:hypothetical protein